MNDVSSESNEGEMSKSIRGSLGWEIDFNPSALKKVEDEEDKSY